MEKSKLIVKLKIKGIESFQIILFVKNNIIGYDNISNFKVIISKHVLRLMIKIKRKINYLAEI
jgi:hypothetical protein